MGSQHGHFLALGGGLRQAKALWSLGPPKGVLIPNRIPHWLSSYIQMEISFFQAPQISESNCTHWCVRSPITFHIHWDSDDFGMIFKSFLVALGPILMTFGALETGLTFHVF